jgi:hypothetical protein
MSTRTQVYCSVLFLAVLATASLIQGRVADAPAAVVPEPFAAAVGRHFQVEPAQVQRLVDAGTSPREVVVVCYLARHSQRQPAQIVADRRAGKSWRDIAVGSGLEPKSFDRPVERRYDRPRAPFVNVYALYHRQARNQASGTAMPLRDDDFVSFVNRHFLLAGQKTARLVAPEARATDEERA